jgi:hypothetical protein
MEINKNPKSFFYIFVTSIKGRNDILKFMRLGTPGFY